MSGSVRPAVRVEEKNPRTPTTQGTLTTDMATLTYATGAALRTEIDTPWWRTTPRTRYWMRLPGPTRWDRRWRRTSETEAFAFAHLHRQANTDAQQTH